MYISLVKYPGDFLVVLEHQVNQLLAILLVEDFCSSGSILGNKWKVRENYGHRVRVLLVAHSEIVKE